MRLLLFDVGFVGFSQSIKDALAVLRCAASRGRRGTRGSRPSPESPAAPSGSGRPVEPRGVSEAELKKLTLTDLHNARRAWLADDHAFLNWAVCAAYGRTEGVGDEEDILKNLLALDLQRRARG
jgi:hypothetical protein